MQMKTIFACLVAAVATISFVQEAAALRCLVGAEACSACKADCIARRAIKSDGFLSKSVNNVIYCCDKCEQPEVQVDVDMNVECSCSGVAPPPPPPLCDTHTCSRGVNQPGVECSKSGCTDSKCCREECQTVVTDCGEGGTTKSSDCSFGQCTLEDCCRCSSGYLQQSDGSCAADPCDAAANAVCQAEPNNTKGCSSGSAACRTTCLSGYVRISGACVKDPCDDAANNRCITVEFSKGCREGTTECRDDCLNGYVYINGQCEKDPCDATADAYCRASPRYYKGCREGTTDCSSSCVSGKIRLGGGVCGDDPCDDIADSICQGAPHYSRGCNQGSTECSSTCLSGYVRIAGQCTKDPCDDVADSVCRGSPHFSKGCRSGSTDCSSSCLSGYVRIDNQCTKDPCTSAVKDSCEALGRGNCKSGGDECWGCKDGFYNPSGNADAKNAPCTEDPCTPAARNDCRRLHNRESCKVGVGSAECLECRKGFGDQQVAGVCTQIFPFCSEMECPDRFLRVPDAEKVVCGEDPCDAKTCCKPDAEAIPADFTCEGAVDLFIVLDMSGSVAQKDFQEESVTFVKNVVDRFKSQNLRVAISLFNDQGRMHLPLSGEGNTVADGIDDLKNVKPVGYTYMGSGIDLMLEQIKTSSDNDVPRAMIVVTDGEDNPPEKFPLSVESANKARAEGVTIFVVPVGEQANRENARLAFAEIANRPSIEHVIEGRSGYADLNLDTFIGDLVAKTCISVAQVLPNEDKCTNEEVDVLVYGTGFGDESNEHKCRFVEVDEEGKATDQQPMVVDGSLVEAGVTSGTLSCPATFEKAGAYIVQVSTNGGKTYTQNALAHENAVRIKECGDEAVPPPIVPESDEAIAAADSAEADATEDGDGFPILAVLIPLAVLAALALAVSAKRKNAAASSASKEAFADDGRPSTMDDSFMDDDGMFGDGSTPTEAAPFAANAPGGSPYGDDEDGMGGTGGQPTYAAPFAQSTSPYGDDTDGMYGSSNAPTSAAPADAPGPSVYQMSGTNMGGGGTAMAAPSVGYGVGGGGGDAWGAGEAGVGAGGGGGGGAGSAEAGMGAGGGSSGNGPTHTSYGGDSYGDDTSMMRSMMESTQNDGPAFDPAMTESVRNMASGRQGGVYDLFSGQSEAPTLPARKSIFENNGMIR